MNAIVTLVIFMAVASPASFKVTRGFLGDWIASPEGIATFKGLFLHAIVFLLLAGLLNMVFGKSSGFETRDNQDDENTMRFQKNRFVD